MNVSYIKQANAWRTRVRELMKDYENPGGKKGLTQQGLANLLYERRMVAQNGRNDDCDLNDLVHDGPRKNLGRDIGRWISWNEKEFHFPNFATMLEIASIFGVDIGYLIGETDYKTEDAKQASKYLGLKESTIEKIRAQARRRNEGPKQRFQNDWEEPFGRLLETDSFSKLIDSLVDYSLFYVRPHETGRNANARISDSLLKWMGEDTPPLNQLGEIKGEPSADFVTSLFDDEFTDLLGFANADESEMSTFFDSVDALLMHAKQSNSAANFVKFMDEGAGELQVIMSNTYRYFLMHSFSELLDELYPSK